MVRCFVRWRRRAQLPAGARHGDHHWWVAPPVSHSNADFRSLSGSEYVGCEPVRKLRHTRQLHRGGLWRVTAPGPGFDAHVRQTETAGTHYANRPLLRSTRQRQPRSGRVPVARRCRRSLLRLCARNVAPQRWPWRVSIPELDRWPLPCPVRRKPAKLPPKKRSEVSRRLSQGAAYLGCYRIAVGVILVQRVRDCAAHRAPLGSPTGKPPHAIMAATNASPRAR